MTCKSAESGVLILENVKLREGGSYKMYDKRRPLPLDHVNLIFRELADFHGRWLRWIHAAKAGKLPRGGDVEPMTFKTFEVSEKKQQ